MRALVVYESMYGNTQAVAEAVADGLRHGTDIDTVEAVEVGAAPRDVERDVDLLVVGAPTHAFSLSRPNSRADAAKRSDRPLVSTGIGIREWIAGLPRTTAAGGVATFDTRLRRPRLPGSAARAALRRMRRLGWRPAARAASFWVEGTTGPLSDGELERARRWGTELAAKTPAAREP
ncbi:MAG TPA: flavodoxin family protein [Acidimicrobiales bacterium]